jgi:hypothetical protein
MRPRIFFVLFASFLLASGCPSEGPTDDDMTGDDDSSDDDDTQGDDDSSSVDADHDGYDSSEDCDDNNASTWPGAPEICDGVDNDCDEVVPDDEVDEDGDLFLACADCDDGDVESYPGAPEQCDGEDNDCDGVVPGDEEDADADDWSGCEGDCDDGDPTVGPGFDELCDGLDNDCDLETDEGTNEDQDDDGFSICQGDCDDDQATVYPDAPEVCDGVDTDCDGILPAGESDLDQDGFPECNDCNDWVSQIYPGAPELCDGLDNNCDGLVAEAACGVIGLSMAHAKFLGENDLDLAGFSVSSIGDSNLDGYGDLLIGAPEASHEGVDTGMGYLILGPVSGTVDLSSADGKLVGEAEDDSAGCGVASAGDVNGDGFDDLLVGAGGHALDAGAAYVVLSPVQGTIQLSSADAILIGENAGDFVGYALSTAGDTNADGFDDLLVGSSSHWTHGNETGAAYLVQGPMMGSMDLASADAKLIGEADGDQAGGSVSTAGDVNGDGFVDLLVGAGHHDNNRGVAYVVLGPTSGTYPLAAADATLEGELANDLAGSAVSTAGDVNGDGFDDVIVGAPGHAGPGGASAGSAYVVLGPVSGTVNLSAADAEIVGENEADMLGVTVSYAGDVQGDGFDDVFVGATGYGGKGVCTGAAYLVAGPLSGVFDVSMADAKVLGEAVMDQAGRSLSSAGDVNGDGYGDLVVGVSLHDASGTSAGAAYLMLGGI